MTTAEQLKILEDVSGMIDFVVAMPVTEDSDMILYALEALYVDLKKAFGVQS